MERTTDDRERSPVRISVAPLRYLCKFIYPHCCCLSDETLYVGPFYLALMPGEVRSHTGCKRLTCR